METTAPSSLWDRSTCVRLVRWLLRWSTVRRLLLALAWAATLLALLYGEENWRGRRTWNRYRQEREARGERFDYRVLIPAPVPEEQNFAATPFFDRMFASKTNRPNWDDTFARAERMVPSPKAAGSTAGRRMTDLVAWEMAFARLQSGRRERGDKLESGRLDPVARSNAAPAVLAGLASTETVLTELSAARRRPHARYAVQYNLEDPWGILLPHLASIKGVVQRLQVKACAELATGNTPRAMEDVRLMLYLGDSVKDEPFLISYLVRVACLQITMQPVWEGLAEHRWSEGQLQELQARFQRDEFLTDLKLPMDGERAAGVLTADLLRRQKYQLSDLAGPSDTGWVGFRFGNLLTHLPPSGWYHLEQLNYCRLFEVQLKGVFDPASRRVFPDQIERRAHEFEREIAGGRLGRDLKSVLHHHLLAALLLPALQKVPLKAAMAQTAADEAALACALERYRLARGAYPETLEALAPDWITPLPRDLLTGEPYKYRRTDDGRFVLYSVGWDEQDGGGVPGKVLFDDRNGDWVWDYRQN